MYDIIVIGARCAGAPTAMLFARRGYKVLLVDRATFPSDVPRGHFIHRQGPARLDRWGLLTRLEATGCPPVTTMISDYGDGPLVGKDLRVDGVAMGYAPRRSVLDHLLVQAAVEAGAELREGFVVDSILIDHGRVVGIRGRDRCGGHRVTELATLTIGADGRSSRLAKAVDAQLYQTAPSLTCWYYSYWSGVPCRGVELYLRPDVALFGFPTHDGLLSIFACWPRRELSRVRTDIEGSMLAAIDQVPELAARVRSGRRVERFYGAADLPNFHRKPHGPGWALVGDAGYHKDPFLALGISDAFRDADQLVAAADAGLSGRVPLGAALAEHERLRNLASHEDYQLNLFLAQFQPLPPDLFGLRAAARADQEATNRLLLAGQGSLGREPVFDAGLLSSIAPKRAAPESPVQKERDAVSVLRSRQPASAVSSPPSILP